MKNQSVSSASHQNTHHQWGIILAGGDGTRLQRYVKTRFGEYRPKQYCAIIGKRTMLRHTIDRVSALFPPDHLLTTISARHFSWAIDDLRDRSLKTIVVQPFNRETGPGILLPLLHVHHDDPKGVVALFPADHFILQEDRYRSFVSQAIAFVSEHRDRIVLLGIPPNSLQYGYGWIEKGKEVVSKDIYTVHRFLEKPDPRLIQYLYEKKCLWNTMTVIGAAENFIKLFEQHMNDVFVPLQRVTDSVGTTDALDVTIDVFRTIPSINFSRCILEKIPEKLCVLHMNGIYWNDWGDEDRIRTDVDFLEHQHHAPSEKNIHSTIL